MCRDGVEWSPNKSISSHLKAYDRNDPIMAKNKKVIRQNEADKLELKAVNQKLDSIFETRIKEFDTAINYTDGDYVKYKGLIFQTYKRWPS